MGMTGVASVWAVARRMPKEYRHRVDAATRCSEYAPIPDLTCRILAPISTRHHLLSKSPRRIVDFRTEMKYTLV